MSAANKKVGITGAGGNIGTTLQRGLSDKYDLALYDIKEIKNPKGKFMEVDLSQRKQIKGIFDGLDALIHLAGNPRPDASRQDTIRHNFQATSFAFDEAHRAGVNKIIFASSNFYHEGDIRLALQGKLKRLITLDMPPTPISLYGQSKVFGESVGRHLSYLGTQFVALRIGWTIPQDNPAVFGGAYMRAVFCSQRDLIEAFIKAIEVETDFLAAFVVSNNARNVFDMEETKETLGFIPQDNAEDYR
jgi:NAD+ dependent glucose-6-phosphate dehydrogenase